MIMTYDFLRLAKGNKNFRDHLNQAILSESDCEIYTDIHKLTFSPKSQTIMITAKSDTSPFSHKIAPKKLPYSALMKLRVDNWASSASDEIMDL